MNLFTTIPIYDCPTSTVELRSARHHLYWSKDSPFIMEEYQTSFLHNTIEIWDRDRTMTYGSMEPYF